MAVRIAIVGAGISGLVAALRLRQGFGADAQIDVYCDDDRPGGILRTVDVGGSPVDVGAEAFIVRRPEALDLVTELGLADRVVSPTTRRPAIWSAGTLHPLPAPALMGIPRSATAVEGLVDPVDLRLIESEPTRPLLWHPGTDMSVGELVAGRFGLSVVDRSVDPMLGGVYSSLARDIGVREAIPALAARLDAGAGSLTEAVGGLLDESRGTGPVFGTLPGGYQVLVDAVIDAARPRLITGCALADVTPVDGSWSVRTAAGTDPGPVYDGVVVAVPAWIAAHLLRDSVPAVAPGLRAVEPASSVVVSIALRPGTELPDNSGVLVATGEDLRAKAFTLSSRKWAHLDSPDRPVSVRASFGRYGAPIPGEDTEPGIDDLLRVWALEDLDRVCSAAGVPAPSSRVVATYLQRWTGGLPRYAPGHLARMTQLVEECPRGLVLAGSSYSGVGVPACIGHAGRAAAALLDDLG